MKEVCDEIARAIAMQDYDWLEEKFDNKVPKTLMISEVIDSIVKQNLMDRMVNHNYKP